VGCVPVVVVALRAGSGGITVACDMFPNDSWNFPCRKRAVRVGSVLGVRIRVRY
jgi:hypothetical protein